jgi:hypothetical protein
MFSKPAIGIFGNSTGNKAGSARHPKPSCSFIVCFSSFSREMAFFMHCSITHHMGKLEKLRKAILNGDKIPYHVPNTSGREYTYKTA